MASKLTFTSFCLSLLDLSEINRLAHNYGLQSIADIKLTDIASTNGVLLAYLFKMEFDAVIVNPLMGQSTLDSAVKRGGASYGSRYSCINLYKVTATQGKLLA